MTSRRRLRLKLRGAVQGVGMRPHLYRLATSLKLDGEVSNHPWGVEVEIEGDHQTTELFVERLQAELPARAALWSLEQQELALRPQSGFKIDTSSGSGPVTAVVLADLATCDACCRDITDSASRRYHYAFTNCTDCGPRYSILRRLPYDRPNTTMAGFVLCKDCQAEYDSPDNRRFHAQPNACPHCGPHLWYEQQPGLAVASDDAALDHTAARLRAGDIVACKGLGGFHLMVDACSEVAVSRLRQRKHRWQKPLALMVRGIEEARAIALLTPEEETHLLSAVAPLLLVRRREHDGLAPSVAPGHPRIGVMLAYSPLHRLLLERFTGPIVATSGNLSDEPICIDNEEARTRLASLTDGWLLHDRPIERPVDDSVAVVSGELLRVMRRARGLAPMPLRLSEAMPTVLALGGHLKNALCLTRDNLAFVSQHIGDLDSVQARLYQRRVTADLLDLYAAAPTIIAHDLHSDYASTSLARELIGAASDGRLADGLTGRLPDSVLRPVQHHHAHLAACLADAGSLEPALGVIWDGAGAGGDGTVWGGEFLFGNHQSVLRVGHLLPFRLLGGDAAARDPRRCAAALWLGAGLDWSHFPLREQLTDLEYQQWPILQLSGLQSPLTTSAGRLFDGLAALLGLATRITYEGQAAIALEHAASTTGEGHYCVRILCAQPAALIAEAEQLQVPEPDGRVRSAASPMTLDWRPLLRQVVEDHAHQRDSSLIAADIHRALADAISEFTERLGARRVALTGGCFANLLLRELTEHKLQQRGCEVLTHRQLPPGDGCLAVGQALVAGARAASHNTSR
jgi:hydrogenase maturation protein HypF